MDIQAPLPLHAWSAHAIAESVRRGDISAREAIAAALDRVAAVNPGGNAIVELHDREAIAQAERLDRRLAAGEPIGLLGGVPITAKINTDVAGWPTTNGVKANQGLVAERDNPAIANLLAAGVVLIGRTNVPAYSWRWFTDNELYGQTLNPWSVAHTPGGSSGAAAVSVCLGMGALAHATDYAGSIRLPAGNCGVIGLRPTAGRVPTYNGTAAEERPLSVQMMSVRNGGPDVSRAAELVFDMGPAIDGTALLQGYARRTRFVRMWSILMAECSVILCPNSGALPMANGLDVTGAPETEKMMRALSWQIVPPLVGLPALSVPVSVIDGLPVGVQIISQRFREDLCLQIGSIVEETSGFNKFAREKLIN